MKKVYHNFLFIICLLWLSSICTGCTSKETQLELMVQGVLDSAGANRAELEKVLAHYAKNTHSDKYKAAQYLIINMKDQYHYDGPGHQKFSGVTKTIDSIFSSGHGIFNSTWDSLQKLHPAPPVSGETYQKDVKILKSSFLVHHIDAAFTAWQYPWAKKLTFSDFCQFILPYKLYNEKPEIWNEDIQSHYSWLIDSMGNSTDPKKACLLLNNKLKKQYNLNGHLSCEWDLNYNDLKRLKQGQCSHLAQITCYVMRAMGIPVTIDYTPLWANKNNRHDWNGLVLGKKTIPFVGSESDPGKTKLEFTKTEWIRRKVAKVYRKTYDIQDEAYGVRIDEEDIVEPTFLDNHCTDVTQSYAPVSDVKVSLDKHPNQKYAYLCVFNNNRWQPISIAKISFFNNAIFKNMGRDVAYLPMSYNGELHPAAAPIILSKTGEPIIVSADKKNLIKCTLLKKYPEDKSNLIEPHLNYELFYWDGNWMTLGKKTADSNRLVYKNVPKGALLLLRCLSKGFQERIFTYENNMQIWW